MVYDPLGVPVPPPPPLLEELPPQATRKIEPAIARMRRIEPIAFLLLDAPIPAVLSSIAGKNNVAKNMPDQGLVFRISAVADAAVVVTVNVEVMLPLACGVTDDGLSEHAGALVTEDETLQVRATAAVKLLTEVTVIVAVAEVPGLTDDGDSVPELGTVKLGTTAVPVRVTV